MTYFSEKKLYNIYLFKQWLVGWFYGMSTLFGLFSAEVGLLSFFLCFLAVISDYSPRLIGSVGRVFANGPGDQGSISGRVIP